MSGGTPLRVLLIEDSENDALLILRELRRGGYEPIHRRVSTPEEMREALGGAHEDPWQVVVSDYQTPRFGALAALEVLRELGYDTPFIVVAGRIGEDAAVAMMRAGARDYVSKEDMARLCPAIEREMREVEVRRERRRVGEAWRALSEASAELSTSLDYSATLARIARLAVPHLADWCAVDILEEDGSTRRLAIEHQDPEKIALAMEVQEQYPPSLEVEGGPPNVLRTGRPEFYPEIPDEMLEAAATSAEHLRVLHEIGFKSAIVVPMKVRGKTLGALTLVLAETERRYTRADLEVAEELARRAALAVDNSRLYDGAQREIARRQRTQEELRELVEHLEIILRGIADGITAQDPSGELIYANEAAARIVGYPTASAFVAAPVWALMRRFEVTDETGRPLPLEELPGRKALRGESAEALLRFREKATGEDRWTVISATPVFDEGGRVRFAVNIFRDITEDRRAAEALRQSEDLYRSVVEQAAENIFLVDARTMRIVEANAALVRSLGYSIDELRQMSLYDIVAHDRKSIDLNVELVIAEGRQHLGERCYRRRDGTIADVEVSVSAVPYDGREAMCVVAHDVTERKRSEERMAEVREAERNRIARDLHDDILQDIVYALQEIQVVQITSESGGSSGLEEASDALRRSVEGLRGAIYELRLKEALDTSFITSVQLLLDLNRRMARYRYELDLVVDDDFPRTLPERNGRQLVRIIQEALANARRHARPEHVRVGLGLDGELARIEVSDDGRGFDVGQPAVGMGQQSMRYRARELGGELRVESEPGSGTRVLFEMPLSRLVAERSPGSEGASTA